MPQVASCPHCTSHPHCKTAAGHPLAPRVSNQTWPADAPLAPCLAVVLCLRRRLPFAAAAVSAGSLAAAVVGTASPAATALTTARRAIAIAAAIAAASLPRLGGQELPEV